MSIVQEFGLLDSSPGALSPNALLKIQVSNIQDSQFKPVIPHILYFAIKSDLANK